MKNNIAKIINFPPQAERCLPNATLVKSEFDYLEIKLNDNRLLNGGIYKDDILIISTLEAVGNGDFIAIQLSKASFDCGMARFIGGGILKLEYLNENYPSKYFKLNKIKLLGRAIRLERDLANGK